MWSAVTIYSWYGVENFINRRYARIVLESSVKSDGSKTL